MSEQVSIDYNIAADELVICGVRYSAHIFRTLSIAEPGTWLRIESRRDGVLSVRTVDDITTRTFNAIAGCGPLVSKLRPL